MDNLSQWCFQLSRSIYDSDIFNKPSDWFKVWIYILWKVNFKDNWLPRWSAYFKYERIERDCKVKYNIVTKICKYLKEKNQIEVKKATHGCIISVVNYSLYQWVNNYKGKTQATQRQDTGNTEVDNIYKNERMKEWKEYNLLSIIETWNKIKWFKSTRKITEEIKKQRSKVMKDYTIDEFELAVNNYYEDTINRTKTNDPKWYDKHRFTFYEFIKQDNWLQKWINK